MKSKYFPKDERLPQDNIKPGGRQNYLCPEKQGYSLKPSKWKKNIPITKGKLSAEGHAG